MATTRETMTGHMEPITDADRRAATRQAFLMAMTLPMLAAASHLAFLAGSQLGDMFVRL